MCKKIGNLSISILFLMVLGACGATESIGIAEDSKDSTTVSSQDKKVESDKQKEDGSEFAQEQKNDELIKEEATFIGQIDSHTIEVETSNGVKAIQISNENDWSFLELNSPIIIEYIENEFGQFELKNYSIK